MKRICLFAPIVFFSIVLGANCGFDGGSGGGSAGPLGVNIKLSPNIIDTGDRLNVILELSDFTENAVAIKIRFPSGLSYVSETSFYDVDDDMLDTGPDEEETASSLTYLVYYLDVEETFGSADRAELTFQLEGVTDITGDQVAVDIDLDNPSISNKTEFDVSTPKFDAQDDAFVRVGPEATSSSTSSASSSSSSSSSSSTSSG